MNPLHVANVLDLYADHHHLHLDDLTALTINADDVYLTFDGDTDFQRWVTTGNLERGVLSAVGPITYAGHTMHLHIVCRPWMKVNAR